MEIDFPAKPELKINNLSRQNMRPSHKWLSTLLSPVHNPRLVPLSLPARHNGLPPLHFPSNGLFQTHSRQRKGCKHGCNFTSIWMFDCIKWILKFEKQSQVSWIFRFHINLHALLQGNARQLHCSNLRGSPHCCYDVNMSRIQVLQVTF